MFWLIAILILTLLVLVLSRPAETETDDDPVWQTVQAVDRLGNEIAHWKSNLWSLWAIALIENLLLRLDKSDKIFYLNKLEDQVIELQQEFYKQHPMSEKMPYFEQETTDLPTH